MAKLILWGGGGHAKVLRECAAHHGYELVAVFDNREIPPPFKDVPLYVGKASFSEWMQSRGGEQEMFGLAAIGGGRGKDRLFIHSLFMQHGVKIPALVHPRAFVAGGCNLSPGVQVLAGATVAVECSLAEECIINTSASVDHECRLEPGVHIGPGAILAGCVEVGQHAFVGAGAVVLPRIKIGPDAIVGAGAVVTRDVLPGTIVYGNPAKQKT